MRPGLPATEQMAGQLPLPHHVGELQATARFQDSEYFAVQGRFIGGKIDHPVGDHHRKGFIREGQVLALDLADRKIRYTSPAKIVPGQLDHLRSEINPGDATLVADQSRRHQQIKTGPAADIEKALSRLNLPQRKGIADPAKGIQEIGMGGCNNGGIIAQGLGPGPASGVSKLAVRRLCYRCVLLPNGEFDLGKVKFGKFGGSGNSGRIGRRSTSTTLATMVLHGHFFS